MNHPTPDPRLPSETSDHSVFSITFQDGCTILGYTSSFITDRVNDICGNTASEQSPGWNQATFAAAHTARMSKTVRCLSDGLTREYARYYRDYLAGGLTPSLTRHGRNIGRSAACTI